MTGAGTRGSVGHAIGVINRADDCRDGLENRMNEVVGRATQVR